MCDIYLEKIRLYEISTALDYEKIEKLKDIINKLNKEIAELRQNNIIKSTDSTDEMLDQKGIHCMTKLE